MQLQEIWDSKHQQNPFVMQMWLERLEGTEYGVWGWWSVLFSS